MVASLQADSVSSQVPSPQLTATADKRNYINAILSAKHSLAADTASVEYHPLSQQTELMRFFQENPVRVALAAWSGPTAMKETGWPP
jgi:hypothetical protein